MYRVLCRLRGREICSTCMLCKDFARAFHATMSLAEIGFRVREVEGIDFGVPGTLSGTGHTAVCWQAVSHDCCSQTIPPVRCLSTPCPSTPTPIPAPSHRLDGIELPSMLRPSRHHRYTMAPASRPSDTFPGYPTLRCTCLACLGPPGP